MDAYCTRLLLTVFIVLGIVSSGAECSLNPAFNSDVAKVDNSTRIVKVEVAENFVIKVQAETQLKAPCDFCTWKVKFNFSAKPLYFYMWLGVPITPCINTLSCEVQNKFTPSCRKSGQVYYMPFQAWFSVHDWPVVINADWGNTTCEIIKPTSPPVDTPVP